MSALSVHVSCEGVRSPVSTARLARAARLVLRAERVTHALVSVALVTRARIAAINRLHLRHRGATDVIAFSFRRGRGGPLVADIYVAPAVTRANALAFGAGVREELIRVVVHGVLHALGYDHPAGEARVGSAMWRRQEALVTRAMRTAT